MFTPSVTIYAVETYMTLTLIIITDQDQTQVCQSKANTLLHILWQQLRLLISHHLRDIHNRKWQDLDLDL